MSSPRLLLVDGTALAYRAFYAIAQLSTRAGEPTNALFGFAKLMRQMLKTWAPTHAVVVFDGGLPEERLALLATYKAQREEMPDGLRAQLPLLNEYLEASSIPGLRVEGQEADDLIATLVAQAAGDGAEVLVATSDKDLLQLVGPAVSVVSLTKQGERVGPAEVEARCGVPPGRVVDWLALVGDTADNIPGVPGIGPKTAADLLRQFASVDDLYLHLDQVASDRIRGLLQEHEAAVRRNLDMVRLRRDCPGCGRWVDCALRPPDVSRLLAFLDRWELVSLGREVRDEASQLF